jgi:hypothetical protein
MPQNLDVFANSDVNIEQQKILAEDFLEIYNTNSNEIFPKIFKKKVIDYLTSKDLMDNTTDALSGQLI